MHKHTNVQHDLDTVRSLIREYLYNTTIDTEFKNKLFDTKGKGLIEVAWNWIKDGFKVGGLFAALRALTWLYSKPKDMKFTDYVEQTYNELQQTTIGKAAAYTDKILTAATEPAKKAIIAELRGAPADVKALLPTSITALLTPATGTTATSAQTKEARTFNGTGLTLLFEAVAEPPRTLVYPKIDGKTLYSTMIPNTMKKIDANSIDLNIDTKPYEDKITQAIKQKQDITGAAGEFFDKLVVVYNSIKAAKDAKGTYPNNFSTSVRKVFPLDAFNDLLNDNDQKELAKSYLTASYADAAFHAWHNTLLEFVGLCITKIDESGQDDQEKEARKKELAEVMGAKLSGLQSIVDFF